MTQRWELSALCSFSRRKKSTRKMLPGEKIHFHLCSVLQFPMQSTFLSRLYFFVKKLLLFLSDSLSICLSLHICQYDCLFAVSLSVCLSVCLSICCLFLTKPASQGWCPGHSCSCPSVVCQSRDYKRARVAHLLLCNRSRSHHKHRSHNFKITINPN